MSSICHKRLDESFNPVIGGWQAACKQLQALHRKAFISSQEYPEAVAFDDADENNSHVMALSEKRDAVGTGRIEATGKIARIAVAAEHRPKFISRERMEQTREKGRRWVISSKDEMRKAVIDVVSEASRRVSIYTHDLEPGIYDDPDFLEIVKHLVLSQAYSRIRVLIADPSRAIKNGNNFVHLGRRLNTYIEFRHVREDLRTHAESFCIADETALVYRLQHERWEGIADTYEPAVAKVYGEMFDEIWLDSEVEIEFRQLGI